MNSQEILSAIHSATIQEKFGKGNIRGDRKYELHYTKGRKFDKPVLIRGTKKQFLPNKEIVSFDAENYCSINELVAMCSKVDNSLQLDTIPNIAEITLEFINEGYLVLKHDNSEGVKYYAISTPSEENDGNSPAFRKWSDLLKVPYAYSKKNPSHLNEANFEYWKTNLTTVQNKETPIDIIYMKGEINIDCGEENYNAFLVINILPAKVTRISEDQFEVEDSTLDARVPLLSNILSSLSGIIMQVGTQYPDMEVSVQQYSLGYTGLNEGRHYVKLILEGSSLETRIPGYGVLKPCVNIDADFIGRHSDFEFVNISLGFIREDCGISFMIPFDEDLKDKFLEEYIDHISTLREIFKCDSRYTTLKEECGFTFNNAFYNSSVNLTFEAANAMSPELGIFQDYLKFFINYKDSFKQGISDFLDDFEGITLNLDSTEFNPLVWSDEYRKIFVASMYNISNYMKLPNDIIKFLLVEYISGQMSKSKILVAPMDILEFVTLLGQSCNTKKLLYVERNIIKFVDKLMEVCNKNKSDFIIYDSHSKYVDSDLL